MGVLWDFDLDSLIAAHGCRFLIDTGGDDGKAAEFAATYAFDQIYCIERSHKKAIAIAFRNATQQRLTVIHGTPERGFRAALEEVPATAPVLFWLASGGREAAALRLELASIAALRSLNRDALLIDLDSYGCDAPEMPDFLVERLTATHVLRRAALSGAVFSALPRS